MSLGESSRGWPLKTKYKIGPETGRLLGGYKMLEKRSETSDEGGYYEF